MSGACHDIGTRNTTKIFEVDQALEMLQAPLVTEMAQKTCLKIFFQIVQVLEMLRVPLLTILAQEMRLKEIFAKAVEISGRLIPVQPHLHTFGMPGSFLIA